MPRIRPPDLSAAVATDRRSRTSHAGQRGRRVWHLRAGGQPSLATAAITRRRYRPVARRVSRGPTAAVQLGSPPAIEDGIVTLAAAARVATRRRDRACMAAPACRAAHADRGFLAGALILVALGSSRSDGDADDAGAHRVHGRRRTADRCTARSSAVPFAGGLLLIFGWIATAAVVPDHRARGAALPQRAPILDRHPWIYPALCALPAPVLVISRGRGAFLLRQSTRLPSAAWFAANAWPFDASFALALAANVAIVRRRHQSLPDQPRCQRAAAHSDRRLHGRPGGVRLCASKRACRSCRRWRDEPLAAAVADRSAASGDRAAARLRACPTPWRSSTCSAHGRCCGEASSTRSRGERCRS